MHDPLRPQFHLLPRANWMNDPCAPRFYQGRYHMFFQYNPGAAVWGDMHWAHATSPDMVYWEHQPVALSPTPGSYDAFGCFTGSVLPGMDIASILYTGTTKCSPEQETIRGEGIREVQCLATSSDPELRSWTKLDKPVLESPPAGIKVTGFRDPCPWKDGDTWYMIVGSGFEKVGGAVLLYRSSDGRRWEYLHPLAEGRWNAGTQTNPVDTGEMWECPDFFPLGDKHVLLYSTERKVFWEIGTLDKQALRFHSETRGLLDHGSYYAMKSMLDARGRRILWGWVEEQRSPDDLKAAGWAGCMALPRVLSVGADDTLRMQVPAEVDALREKSQTWHAPQGKPPDTAAVRHSLAGMAIAHRAGIVSCAFKPGERACSLELRMGADPVVSIEYDAGSRTVKVGGKVVALTPDQAGVSTIDMWVDGSVIEAFVDGREAVTVRSYTGGDGEMHLEWGGAADALQKLSVSGVQPISKDRLTS